MADIFISYSRTDRPRIDKIASALEDEGLSVWWDRYIGGGSEFSKETESRLEEAKAVLVAWSETSIDSMWVADEATVGRDRGSLVPIAIDDVQPKLGFRQIQTIEFQKWNGRRDAPAFRALVAALVEKLDEPPLEPKPIPKEKIRAAGPSVALFGVVGFVAAIVLAIVLISSRGGVPTETQNIDENTFSIASYTDSSASSGERSMSEAVPEWIGRVLARNGLRASLTDATDLSGAKPEFSISGDIVSGANGLEVTSDLFDETSRRILWSRTVSRNDNDRRLLTRQVAVDLANILRCATEYRTRLGDDSTTENFQLTLRMCEVWTSDGDEFVRLPSLSKELLSLMPNHAQVMATHAANSAFVAGFARTPSEQAELRTTAYDFADRALASDPGIGAAYWAKATVPDKAVSIQQRVEYLREALRVDPEFAWSRNHLGHSLASTGQLKESLRYYEQFTEDFPLDFRRAGLAAAALARVGGLATARVRLQKLSNEFPHAKGHVVYAHFNLELFGDAPENAGPLLEDLPLRSGDRQCLQEIIDARVANHTLTVEDLNLYCGTNYHPQRTELLAIFGHVDAAFDFLYKHKDKMSSPTDRFPRITLFEPHT
ncbi:MAG: TIR domain-containing protein, partial [Pseudomonadota bacterium]